MSQPIGDLTVRVLLEIASAEKGAKSFSAELKNIKTGEDQVATSTVSLNDKLAKTGLSMMGLREIGNALSSTFSAIFGTIKASNDAYQQFLSSNRQLSATSKLTGANLNDLQKTSEQTRKEYSLSSGQANLFTIELTKLSQKAGDVSKVQQSINALMDLGAGQGLNAEQTLYAIKQAILGIDEGTDKLFQKNPSVLYDEYARSINTTAGKLTDQEKAQALLNAVLIDGGKLTGKYKEYLETAAGKQQLLNTQLLETKIAIGEKLQPVLLPLLQAFSDLLEYYNSLGDLSKVAVLSFLAIGVALKDLSPILVASGVSFRDLLTAVKNLNQAGPFISGFASEIALMLGPASVAGLAIAALGALVHELIIQIKDAIYWKNKLANINENDVKIDYKNNPNSDATYIPLKTNEEGKLNILSTEKGAEFLQKDEIATQGILLEKRKDEKDLLTDKNAKLNTGNKHAQQYTKEVKEAIKEVRTLSDILSDIFVNTKTGVYSDLSTTVEDNKNKLLNSGSGRVRGFYGPDDKNKRADEAKETSNATAEVFNQSLSLAQQLSNVLGIGADTFAGKLISGLQEGLSLANSVASLIATFAGGGGGGIFSLLGLASGGYVPGSGSGDSVPAMLTPGEFVINKARASKLGSNVLNWLNGGGSVINPSSNHSTMAANQLITIRVIPEESVIKSGNIHQSWRYADKIINRRKA